MTLPTNFNFLFHRNFVINGRWTPRSDVQQQSLGQCIHMLKLTVSDANYMEFLMKRDTRNDELPVYTSKQESNCVCIVISLVRMWWNSVHPIQLRLTRDSRHRASFPDMCSALQHSSPITHSRNLTTVRRSPLGNTLNYLAAKHNGEIEMVCFRSIYEMMLRVF
jgi:hypothetical protein